jgi:hypothetical protein
MAMPEPDAVRDLAASTRAIRAHLVSEAMTSALTLRSVDGWTLAQAADGGL